MEKPYKIGIDARFYADAGPGRYVKNIVEHLEKVDTKNLYLIFLRQKGFDKYIPINPNFKKVLADVTWYSWKEQTVFLWILLKNGIDLLFVPHFNIPVLFPKKLVTAIPDIIMHTFSTERGTTLPKPYFKFKKFVYKIVMWWAVVRSHKVIVPSNDVMNDFLKVYPAISKDKYVLAYEGVDPAFKDTGSAGDGVLNEFNITDPYFLHVGSSYEHKNLYFLIDSFAEFLKTNPDFKLVLVGKKDKYSDELYSYILGKNLTAKVIMPGVARFVSDAEIVSLRKHSKAYVFASLKEGFSLTPMESQVLGIPCLISDIPCHREIYEDSVLYFDPRNKNEFVQKMSEIAFNTELRKRLTEKGYTQAKKYDWMKTAEITLGVFNSFLKNA